MAKSMTYTNGRILVNSRGDADALSQAARQLTRYLDEEKAIQAEVLLDDTVAYPCYIVPPNVSWDDIEQALRPNVQLKAINEDIIVLPDTRVISQRYYFTEEEKEKMALKSAQKNQAAKALKQRKAVVMKEFKAQIDALEDEVDELSAKYAAGHEERDHVCHQKLNFADGKKYFVGVNDDEVYKVEPLEGTDRQLRVDAIAETPVRPHDLFTEPDVEEPSADGPGHDEQLDTSDNPVSEPGDSPFPI